MTPSTRGRRVIDDFPHLAVTKTKFRYDLGDEIAQRAGTPVVTTACEEEVTSTLATRRADLVRCERCRQRAALPTGADCRNGCEDGEHVFMCPTVRKGQRSPLATLPPREPAEAT